MKTNIIRKAKLKITLRQVSKMLVVSVFFLSFLFPPAKTSEAASLYDASVEIGDSRAGQTNVPYNFDYKHSTTGQTIESIVFQFCTSGGSYGDTCTGPTGFNASSAVLANDDYTNLTNGDMTPATNTITGTFSAAETVGSGNFSMDFTGITNPSTTNTSFYVWITTFDDTTPSAADVVDQTTVVFATLTSTSIAVDVTVDPTFTFTVAGVASSQTVNTETTTVTTTASAIDFDNIASTDNPIAAHDVTVTTNAANGYKVTIKSAANPPLSDVGSGENIDNFTGTNASPTTWSAPAGTAASVNTGFAGYTTEDSSLCTGTANRFTTASNWAGLATTAYEVICSSTFDYTTSATRIGYQVEVNQYQPPGNYSGTYILVATPTF